MPTGIGNLQTLPLVVGVAGAVLLYGAVTNRNPLDVIKLALTGKPLNTAKPLFNAGASTGGPTTSLNGPTLPGTGSSAPGAPNSGLSNDGAGPTNVPAKPLVFQTPFIGGNLPPGNRAV